MNYINLCYVIGIEFRKPRTRSIMSLKNKTRKELEGKIEEIENLIHKRGIGADYLSRAERIQRDVNLALILGGTAAILGVTAWSIYKLRGE
jgi:hypothetical protein